MDRLAVGEGDVVEVLDVEVAEVEVFSVGTHVVGAARPDGLFVELDFIGLHTAEEAGAQSTVADGEGVFHPNVGHTGEGSGAVVPQCERMLGSEVTQPLHLIFGDSVGVDKGEWVVDVTRFPKPEFVAVLCALPLVHGFCLVGGFGDFEIAVAVQQGQCSGCRLVRGAEELVLTFAFETDVIALVRKEEKTVFVANQGKALAAALFGILDGEPLTDTIVLQATTARFEHDVEVDRFVGCAERGLLALCHEGHTSAQEKEE